MNVCRLNWLGFRRSFPENIEVIRLLVRFPGLLYSPRHFGIINVEANYRQNHGANAHVRRPAFTDVPAFRAPKQGGADLTFGANLVEHSVEFVAETYARFERH